MLVWICKPGRGLNYAGKLTLYYRVCIMPKKKKVIYSSFSVPWWLMVFSKAPVLDENCCALETQPAEKCLPHRAWKESSPQTTEEWRIGGGFYSSKWFLLSLSPQRGMCQEQQQILVPFQSWQWDPISLGSAQISFSTRVRCARVCHPWCWVFLSWRSHAVG